MFPKLVPPIWQEALVQRRENFLALSMAERWWQGMFWGFWLYLALFPFGHALREVLPSFCALCLIFYYRYNWKNSTLRRFGAKWLFVLFFATALWGVVMSQDVWQSFLHVGRGTNKAFVLPFVAMECARGEKELRRLIWALALACFWQGCNGIYQSITGFDFVDNTPLVSGRLTGSLSDYRVGNYIALTLIPASSLWFVLRQRMGRPSSLALMTALLGPGLYLLYFTYTRNGYLAVLAALVLWYAIVSGRVNWRPLALVALVLVVAGFVLPQRLGVETLVGDGRWDLWRFGWAVFMENPWQGAGFGQYNVAFRELGFVPSKDPLTISHPHSIYLQLLCEAGIVGFVLGLSFLLGMLYWGWRHIRPRLSEELQAAANWVGRAQGSAHWRMTGLLWCGWGAYLVSGVFGHDFFRIWWQAMVMAYLGVMIGATVNGARGPEGQGQAPQGQSTDTLAV